MLDFKLTADDPRLGHYDEVGALVRPSQIIDGKPYEANHCSHYNFTHKGDRYIVAIPVWFTDAYTVVIDTPVKIEKSGGKVNFVKGDE